MLVSTLDASQLQDLSWKVMQEEVRFFDSDTIVPALRKCLETHYFRVYVFFIYFNLLNFSENTGMGILGAALCLGSS